jgi:hypothetical protein
MAWTPIDLGTTANDGTGDTPREAGQKINSRFAEAGSAYEKDTSTTPAASKIPQADANGYLHPGWLAGVRAGSVGFAYNIKTDTFIRTGDAADMPVGQFCGTTVSPIFQNLRRVVLDDAGTVYKEIDWLDFTKHTDGTDVALDGSNGQIMVEYQPAFIRTGVVGDWYYLEISHTQLPGFQLHPLFDGVDVAYQGAYEASVYTDGTTDKLYSIAKSPADGTSNIYPVTNRAETWGYTGLTADATDTLAEARGAGWQQADFWTKHWERCLMLVGWAGFNFQSMIGEGRTGLSGGDWVNDSYIGPCGLADAVSGYYGNSNQSYSSILGIENPFGHIWERVASLISDWDVYVKGTPPFDYSATTGWDRLTDHNDVGVTLPSSNGYGGTPHSGLGFVLPADITGSSSSRFSDYYYQDSGLRVFIVGGSARHGTSAGPFYWLAHNSAASTSAYIGGRLCFKKLAA